MRQDVTFPSEGLNCAGWLYVPDDLGEGERRPAVVMAHGFSAVKEMHLANFAYTEPGLSETAIPAVDWFERHLLGRQRVEIEQPLP